MKSGSRLDGLQPIRSYDGAESEASLGNGPRRPDGLLRLITQRRRKIKAGMFYPTMDHDA